MSELASISALLSSIGHAHNVMKRLALRVHDDPTVTDVTHWFDLLDNDSSDGSGFRFEEYVSVDLSSGCTTDWCIEIDGYELAPLLHLVVDIRRYDREREETRTVFVDQDFPSATDCATALVSAVEAAASAPATRVE